MQDEIQETFILIEKPNGELRIGVQEPKLSIILVECFQCKKKNQCCAKAQFMKCGFCTQINKVYDPDPMFCRDQTCPRCTKRVHIQKNAVLYRCPHCQQIIETYYR